MNQLNVFANTANRSQTHTHSRTQSVIHFEDTFRKERERSEQHDDALSILNIFVSDLLINQLQLIMIMMITEQPKHSTNFSLDYNQYIDVLFIHQLYSSIFLVALLSLIFVYMFCRGKW